MRDEGFNATREVPQEARWDHSCQKRFYDYYAEASESKETIERFSATLEVISRVFRSRKPGQDGLDVADIGCGAGTQSILWAEQGHRVHGLDVNERLLQLARSRAKGGAWSIEFCLGSAVELPWPDESMDVCIVPELLEHVADWRSCLLQFKRILRPEGILFISTSNKLCPVQKEFNLPLYSWYPAATKRYCEHLAQTTRPQLANFATYPAVNWFSFYSLRSVLASMGFECLDRFDLIEVSRKTSVVRPAVFLIRKIPILRWLGHVLTPYTMLLGIKTTSPELS